MCLLFVVLLSGGFVFVVLWSFMTVSLSAPFPELPGRCSVLQRRKLSLETIKQFRTPRHGIAAVRRYVRSLLATTFCQRCVYACGFPGCDLTCLLL